jgi:hypothetical protein
MRALLTVLGFLAFCETASAQKHEPKYEGKTLGYWLEKLQHPRSDAERDLAARAVGAFGKDGAAAVPVLLEMTRDYSEAYRMRVYGVLRALGPGAKSAVAELAVRLNEMTADLDESPVPLPNLAEFRELITLFGSLHQEGKVALPALIACLKHPDLQDAAGRAICEIGPTAKEAIPRLRQVILKCIDERESQKTDRLLGFPEDELYKLGPDVVPLLVEMIQVADPRGQRGAVRQLSRLGTAANKAAPHLIALLKNDDLDLRVEAAEVLHQLHQMEGVISALVELLQCDDTWKVRRVVILLGDIGPDARDALPALKQLLEPTGNASSQGSAASASTNPIRPASFSSHSDLEANRRQQELQKAVKVAIRKISAEEKK